MILTPVAIPGLAIGGFALLLAFVWISMAYFRTRNPLVGYFAIFFLFKVIAFSLIVLPYLFAPQNLELIGKSFVFGSMVAFEISLIFLGLLAVRFWFPRYKALIIGSILAAVVVQFILGLIGYSSPIYLPDLNIVIAVAPFSAAIWFLVAHAIFMAGLGVVFMYEGIKSSNTRLKIRYISLGFGMIVACFSGSLLFLTTSMVPVYTACAYINTFAHLLMLFGIVYKVKPTEERGEEPVKEAIT